jgi:tetratricopeptide (TPR) repeat protein
VADTAEAAARWRLKEELFHRALTVAQDARADEVRAWCGDDEQLYKEVWELLASEAAVEELIGAALTADVADALMRRKVEVVDPWLGRVLGAFRVEELVGRGGMGVVYRGRRVADRFEQVVAIKVMARHLRASGPDLVTKSAGVRQFLLEREALAKLEHPGIARLLDGGVVEGVPYLVMEYVDGRRIDAVCDEAGSKVERVVELILALCEAVGYVHRNLILHRDLKPGNVMVTVDGAVKLLDFGTLKLVGPMAAASEMTQAGMRSMTLRYASPEHIRGDAVSTASDVYSLGMMLYRLLAGRLPEGGEDLSVAEYLEWLEHEAPRPPVEVRGPQRTVRARRLATDLDAIVLKAIRFEARDRYAGVEALAADLRNALEDRPVAAREGQLRYRLGKLYRRHRTGVLGAAATLLALFVGVAAIGYEGRLARLETRRAEAGVERERKLAHLLLFDYFDQLEQIPGSTDARRKAVTEAVQYLDGLSRTAAGSKLELDQIKAYTEMGSVLGNPYAQNLGDALGALRTLTKALDLAKARVAKEPGDLASLDALSGVQLVLGSVYLGTGDTAQAQAYLNAAAEESGRIAKDTRVDAAMLLQGSLVADMLGDLYNPGKGLKTADRAQATRFYEQSYVYRKDCLRFTPRLSRCLSGVAISQYKLGLLAEDVDPEVAAGHYQEALATLGQFSAEEQRSARIVRLDTYFRSRLGLMDMEIGRTAEGTALLEQMQARFRASIARDPIDNRVRFDLAALDADVSDADGNAGMERAAEAAAKEMLEQMAILLGHDAGNIRWQANRALGLILEGRAESKLGEKAAAARASREGLEQATTLARQAGASPYILGIAADALLADGATAKDGKMQAEALAFAGRVVAATPAPTPMDLLRVAKADRLAGKVEDARSYAERALALLPKDARSKFVMDEVAEARGLAAVR